MGIRAVFFDAADTLFELRGSVGAIYSKVMNRRGVRSDPETLDKSFRAAFNDMSQSALRGNEREWWLEVVRRTFADALPPEKLRSCFDELFDFFRTSQAWRLYPEVRDTLEDLQTRGFLLGIISNFDSRLRDILSHLNIDNFFDQVVYSWDVGTAKPDRRIFSAALARVKIRPSEAVHVGDSILSDYKGAKAAEMSAILLDRHGQHTSTDLGIIRNLAELPPLVNP